MSEITNVDLESRILGLFYAGLIGGFTRLAIARLVISTHPIIFVLVDYSKQLFGLVISLAVIHVLFKYVFRREIGVVWRIVGWLVLLNFTMIFSAVVYVLFFNLLNMQCDPNPLLALCSVFGRLSDPDLQIAGYGAKAIFGMLSLYLATRYMCSLQMKSRRTRYGINPVYLLLFLVVLSIIIPLHMFSSIDSRYEQVLIELRSYGERCDDTKQGLECLWDFALQYRSRFRSTYRKPCLKPRQLLIGLPFSVDDKNFLGKLAVVSRSGACFEFAISVARLIKELYGYETRVVSFIGWDHAIPEVKIDSTWYIIDAAYTTPNYPVDIGRYMMHLQKNYSDIYNSLKSLVDFETGEDLSKEHHLELKET